MVLKEALDVLKKLCMRFYKVFIRIRDVCGIGIRRITEKHLK